MDKNFKVIVEYQDQDGYVEYDGASKKVTVFLEDESARCAVEEYLTKQQAINVPQSLINFEEVIIDPCENVENFKRALTRMWGHTGVLVQWSKPV